MHDIRVKYDNPNKDTESSGFAISVRAEHRPHEKRTNACTSTLPSTTLSGRTRQLFIQTVTGKTIADNTSRSYHSRWGVLLEVFH